MAGILVELAISWLLLWLVGREHLSVLGFRPTQKRLMQFGIGFLIAATCCTLYELLSTLFVDNQWIVNKKATANGFIASARWILISVLYEELIFRGALLYIAIKKIGELKAIILSAICFGMYHWFSYNLFGNPVMMVITFFMTGIVGLAWAYAFAKTKSMYLPVGLHFGWNLFCMAVFSNGSSMASIFVRANDNKQGAVLSWVVFLFQVLALPGVTWGYLRWREKRREILQE